MLNSEVSFWRILRSCAILGVRSLVQLYKYLPPSTGISLKFSPCNSLPRRYTVHYQLEEVSSLVTMCYFDQKRWSCGYWRWSHFRQHCPKEYRKGETCGLKLVHSVFDEPNKCRLCHDIEKKKRRRDKMYRDIARWEREGNRASSIERVRREVAAVERQMIDMTTDHWNRVRGVDYQPPTALAVDEQWRLLNKDMVGPGKKQGEADNNPCTKPDFPKGSLPSRTRPQDGLSSPSSLSTVGTTGPPPEPRTNGELDITNFPYHGMIRTNKEQQLSRHY